MHVEDCGLLIRSGVHVHGRNLGIARRVAYRVGYQRCILFLFFFVGCLSCCCCGISNPNTGTKFVPAMPRNSRSILVAGSQDVKVTHMEPVTVARQTVYAMARNFNFACQ